MMMNKPITEVIKQRFSCRAYQDKPITEEHQRLMREFMGSHHIGPLGTQSRFILIAATESDRKSLKGLGTYGFIKNAAGFIVGAMDTGEKDLEDYGYLLEHAILYATDIGLGTCWLGGSFTKSSFAEKVHAGAAETVPAVTAIGYIGDGTIVSGLIRKRAGAVQRLSGEQLFFDRKFGQAISAAEAGVYAVPLEMVRWAPSASNRQPWRIVRCGNAWHFFLQRIKGYGKGSMLYTMLRLADLQRVDMGIAMCHFELAANELGMKGVWTFDDPGIVIPRGAEYTVSWIDTTYQ
jgi:hypothetical protein